MICSFCHFKGERRLLTFKASGRTVLVKLNGSSGSVPTMEDENIDQFQLQTGGCLPLFSLFVFPHFPKIVLFVSPNGVQLTQEVYGKGHISLGDGEVQAWGCAGWEQDVFTDDHCMPQGRSTPHWQQLALMGARAHHFREGFLNYSLTSPPQHHFQSPGNSLMQLNAMAVWAYDREEA